MPLLLLLLLLLPRVLDALVEIWPAKTSPADTGPSETKAAQGREVPEAE